LTLPKLLWSKKYKKSENTIIKWNDITQESYFNNIGIGDYLESLVENAKANTQYFSSQTDTINQKVKFCETAFYFMRDLPTTEWQLTSKLRTLCQKIFEHISSNNQA
jgi:hypothetical protein